MEIFLKMRPLGIFKLLCGIVLLFAVSGCEIIRDAIEAEMEYGVSDRGSSDEFRPRFVIAVCSIVKFPRALWIEQEVDFKGERLWINKNQLFDSKRVRRARAVPRPGNPDVCDLELMLDATGKNHWQMLVAASRGQAVALMIDQRCVATFVPEMPETEDDRFEWVKLRVGLDSYTARGVVRYAPKNHDHYNPEASNWFKF